ncbi:MAG: hypothetical protein FWE78_05940 [Methanimicrococcus sp.]|nr:hypothetical protein [Methanimicrococcus sp.]
MDLEQFIKKADRVIRRNRMVYDFLEFFAIALILLLIAIFFNVSEIFKHISITEPYTGLYTDIPFFTVKYEVAFTFFLTCLLALLILEIFEKNRKSVYKKLNKKLPKHEKSADVVERSYPQLKDRLKTAYDNRTAGTIIAADLKKSVTQDVDSVTTVGLADSKRLTYSMATIVVSGILLAAVFFTGFVFPVTPDDVFDRFPNGTITQPPFTPETGGNDSSGVPTNTTPIAPTPGIDIDVTLPPGAGAGPGSLLENSTNHTFYPSTYYPPQSLSSNHYYEYLPEGYEDIIKDYFKKLAEQS